MSGVVSFVVPIFNVEKYLEQCVSSILSQTYDNIEVILVDDGSTDNSGKICDNFAQKDKRVKVIHKKNGGLSSARNAGLDALTGDYVVFTDSDDYVSSDMVQTMLNKLESTDSDLIMCNFAYTDENGNVTDNFTDGNESGEYDNNQLLSTIAAGWTFGAVAWNKIYKAKLFDNNLRFTEGKLAEDEFMAHRLLAKVKKAFVISDVLYYYRQRSGSIINSDFNIKKLDSLDALIDRVDFFYEINRQDLAYISSVTAMRSLAGFWQYRKTGKEINIRLHSYRNRIRDLSKKIGKQNVDTKFTASVFLFRRCFPLYLLARKTREAL